MHRLFYLKYFLVVSTLLIFHELKAEQTGKVLIDSDFKVTKFLNADVKTDVDEYIGHIKVTENQFVVTLPAHTYTEKDGSYRVSWPAVTITGQCKVRDYESGYAVAYDGYQKVSPACPKLETWSRSEWSLPQKRVDEYHDVWEFYIDNEAYITTDNNLNASSFILENDTKLHLGLVCKNMVRKSNRTVTEHNKTTPSTSKVESGYVVDAIYGVYGEVLNVQHSTKDDEEDTTSTWEEDNDASDEGGIWKYIIPPFVGGCLVGWWRKRRKNKKQQKDDDPEPEPEPEEEEQEEEEDDEPDQLQMQVYKDFGDTLLVGDKGQQVNALIVRKPKKGPEYVDEELTRQIQITSGDEYLHVEMGDIENGWKTAYVWAPEAENPPQEGIVKFVLANEGASYTNRLHFKVTKGEILFFQENLTLPACYGPKAELPFLVNGIEKEKAKITAAILDIENKSTNDYRIDVEWDEKKQYYLANINDQLQDKEKDKGVPGTYATYAIEIVADNQDGVIIKGYLPLYRYYMGLVLDINPNVACYLEEQDPMRHELQLPKVNRDGKECRPAENRCTLKLYDWDDETNELLVIDPRPENIIWNVRDDEGLLKIELDEGVDLDNSVAERRQRLIEYQKMLDALGLQLQPRYNETVGLYYMLYCRTGVLNAPNRFDVEFEISASYQPKDPKKPKIQKFKRVVHLLSQPKREFASYEARVEAVKRERKIEDKLRQLEDDIYMAGLNDRLAPLLFFIRLQIEFYKEEYGFYERNIKAIYTTYQHVMEGVGQEAIERAEACDDLEQMTYEWLESAHQTIEDMPLAVRIGIGFATLGSSEAAFMCIEVPYSMKKYVDAGGNSVYEMFKVGVTPVVKAYLFENAFKAAASAVKIFGGGAISGAKGLGKMAWNGTMSRKAVTEFGMKLGKGMYNEVSTGLKAWTKTQFGWQVGMAEKAARKSALRLLEEGKQIAKGSRFNAAELYGKNRAVRNIQDLMAAVELYDSCPSVENFLLRNRMIKACQGDKRTMFMLKNTEQLLANQNNKAIGNLLINNTRMQFNKTLKGVYSQAGKESIKELAKETGINPAMIRIKNATSSNIDDLLSGKTVTFDNDITFYYIDKNGVTRYFDQKLTERIYNAKFREALNAITLPKNAAGIGVKPTAAQLLKTQELADRLAKHMDQTVIEDILKHHESYGVDLEKMIVKALHGEGLSNPKKVADAVLHKGLDRFNYAAKLINAADEITDNILKNELKATAIGEIMEGCRQQVKVFKLIESRDVMRNFTSKIPTKLREAIAVMEEMTSRGNASLGEVEYALQQLGYNSFESVTKAVSDLVIKVG